MLPLFTLSKHMKQKGIVLVAFGKKGYGYAAWNMAQSIKVHSPNLPIHLVTTKDIISKLVHTGYFDSISYLKDSDYKTKGRIDAGKAKTHLYNYLPFKENIYLDVDGIVLQDIEPLFDACREIGLPYQTDVKGTGKKGEAINYDIWAKHEDTWDFFGLDDHATLCAPQTSWAYIKRGKEAKQIFTDAKAFYLKGFPKEKLKMQWGGSTPDELIFAGSCAKNDLIPAGPKNVVFFGWRHVNITFTEISEKHYVLSLYGNGVGRTLTKLKYREYYDRLVAQNCRKHQVTRFYKQSAIMRDKFVNG